MTSKERRINGNSLAQAISMLDSAQSFALGEYLAEGGELDFIRQTENGPLAVCHNKDALITIDSQGVVNDHPDIRTRAE